MKQKASKKFRLKLPKNKRFGRFFLRRLLICLLAAGIGGAFFMQHIYRKRAKEFGTECNERWLSIIKQYTELSEENTQKKTQAERILSNDGPQTLANGMIQFCDEVLWKSPASFEDHAVILTDAQEMKRYVSAPMIRTAAYTGEGRKNIDLGPVISGQIEKDLIAYRQSVYDVSVCALVADDLLPEWTLNLLAENDAFVAWIRDIFLEPALLRISVDPEWNVCKAVVGLRNTYDNEIIRVYEYGTETDNCTELASDYILKDGKYQKTDDKPNREEGYITDYMTFCGFPEDSDSIRTANMIFDPQQNRIHAEREKRLMKEYDTLTEIISDETGEKRKAYYREAIKEISETYKYVDEPDKYIWYSEQLENIQTPEERLESCRSTFGQYPYIFMNYMEDTPFYTGHPDHTPFYSINSFTMKINGETWYLTTLDHADYPRYYKPLIIMFGILVLLGAVLLALLWSFPAYLRFRRKYERDEYRRSLTASLAHDLKSPLMAISSFAENIVNDVQPGKRQHYAEAILDNTSYMDNIIVNVLELSGLEKRRKVKKETLDLIEMTQELLSHMKEEFAERNLSVTVSGRCIQRANRQMMMQAIRNLLDNAVKFTPDGGRITVTGKWHTLCMVNDTAEKQISNPEQLCEAFAKGDNARSNRMGTGLGLSLIRQIARLNRLGLRLESRSYQFTVRLKQNVLLAPVFCRRPKPAKQP